MKKAMLITYNHKVETMELHNSLDFFYKHLECDSIQVAIPRMLRTVTVGLENVVMVVDEEGALKSDAKLNVSGSLLHGSTIYGNIMIVKDNGPEFEGLTEDEIAGFTGGLVKLLKQLHL